MNNQIGKKLLIKVLQVSTCVTIVFTIISFYLDYQTEQSILSDTRQQIQENFTENLALSVYNFDTPSIQTQVKTLLNFQEIISAKLSDEKGEVLDRVTATNQEFRFLETWTYTLISPEKTFLDPSMIVLHYKVSVVRWTLTCKYYAVTTF